MSINDFTVKQLTELLTKNKINGRSKLIDKKSKFNALVYNKIIETNRESKQRQNTYTDNNSSIVYTKILTFAIKPVFIKAFPNTKQQGRTSVSIIQKDMDRIVDWYYDQTKNIVDILKLPVSNVNVFRRQNLIIISLQFYRDPKLETKFIIDTIKDPDDEGNDPITLSNGDKFLISGIFEDLQEKSVFEYYNDY